MSYKFYYFDDQTVGAEDLNKLVKMFASNGVADNFQDGVPYNISKLGEIVSANAGEGIVPETASTLKVSYDLNTVTIQPGIAFFKDGTVIEIETEETLSALEDTDFYVYLESDALKNKAYPALSANLPEGNVVPLAKISETGEITDLRRFARGKVPSFYSSDAGLLIEKTIEISKDSDLLKSSKRLTLIENGNSYRYLILITTKNYSDDDEDYEWAGVLVYDKEKDMCYNFSRDRTANYDDYYANISKGTAFHVMDCWYGSYNHIIFGNLYFENGKTELEMSGKSNVSDSIFNKFTYPFEIKVIAL